MKQFNLILFIMSLTFVACQHKNQEVFWVSGYQAQCDQGADKGKCLMISRANDLDSANWELFYAPIEKFNFEGGYLKKIRVRKSKNKKVPADASQYLYVMIEELEKQEDPRRALAKSWTLIQMNGEPIDRATTLPSLNIDLKLMMASGNSGCNQYSGKIAELGTGEMEFGPLRSTKKGCMGKNIEAPFFKELANVRSYALDENLSLKDQAGNTILTFLPTNEIDQTEEKEANERLHDIWVLTKLNGQAIQQEDSIPRLEINLTKMLISGDDGCNQYQGPIQSVDDQHLQFGTLAVTEMACANVTKAREYYEALAKVKSYSFDDRNLILMDENDTELLSFMKTD